VQKQKSKEPILYRAINSPGPGVPPCLISGEVVAKEVVKEYGGSSKHRHEKLINEKIERS
jgi:hypothetical protein